MNTFEEDRRLYNSPSPRQPFLRALIRRRRLPWLVLAVVVFAVLATLMSKVTTFDILAPFREVGDCCGSGLKRGKWVWENNAWKCDAPSTCNNH